MSPAAPIISKALWESDNLAEDDTDLVALNVELEQIGNEFTTPQLNGNNGTENTIVTDLEIELIETNNDFWKG